MLVYKISKIDTGISTLREHIYSHELSWRRLVCGSRWWCVTDYRSVESGFDEAVLWKWVWVSAGDYSVHKFEHYIEWLVAYLQKCISTANIPSWNSISYSLVFFSMFAFSHFKMFSWCTKKQQSYYALVSHIQWGLLSFLVDKEMWSLYHVKWISPQLSPESGESKCSLLHDIMLLWRVTTPLAFCVIEMQCQMAIFIHSITAGFKIHTLYRYCVTLTSLKQ